MASMPQNKNTDELYDGGIATNHIRSLYEMKTPLSVVYRSDVRLLCDIYLGTGSNHRYVFIYSFEVCDKVTSTSLIK